MNFTSLTTHLSAFLDSPSLRRVNIDGASLSLPDLIAVARHKALTTIDESRRERVQASRDVLNEKLQARISIYGVSTGFGGSASTRTQDHLGLGLALFQMQHCGIMSSVPDHLASMTMPESWVRAAILVRINSLIRGHSGVRWELPLALQRLLTEDITPLVPLRGSISASGDLSPLSYVAGTIMGNPSIRVYDTCPQSGQRIIIPSPLALTNHNIFRFDIQAKEHLGLLNGTAFSAAVASLALYDAVQLAFLAQICTAMATEALLGSRGSFSPFVNDVARPHPGQIDVARTILALLNDSKLARTPQSDACVQEDKGTLKQDRYALRTAPQFIGPQIEDIHCALLAVTQELNSTTDNPLIESATRTIHDTGNFQAMAVTNAMEKTRLALHHLGKILFAQTTEMMNPDTNKGLPPSLAATDPSLNFHCKGVEISLAAYISELGFLANPVSTHIQSAEMHNQAVNSLALLSARQTVTAADVLTLIIASCMYSSCQALDLRALQFSLVEDFQDIIARTSHFFWTKEPFGPIEEYQYERTKTPLTASGKATIGKGPEHPNSLDSDHIFRASFTPHSHSPHPCECLTIPNTPYPLACFPGTDVLRGKTQEEAGPVATEEENEDRRPKQEFTASIAIPEMSGPFVESQTPDAQTDADVNSDNSCANAINGSTSDSSDNGTLSDDDDGSVVSPCSGSSSLTSMTSMASLSGNHAAMVVPTISDAFIRKLEKAFSDKFWSSTTMDAEEQVRAAVGSLIDTLTQEAFRGDTSDFSVDLFSLRSILPEYRATLETECLNLVTRERKRFLTCPAEHLPTPGLLGLGSRRIHRFLRKELGIGMHGAENLVAFEGGLNSREATTGENISLIYDAIKNGSIQPVLKDILESLA